MSDELKDSSSSQSFVHLHVHTQYSLLEAACKTKDIAKKAKSLGMPAVAITDNGNMFGAVEFYFACKAEGVKPILGLDVYLAPKGRLVKGEDKEALTMPNRRLVLLAKNFKGYQNLCQLSSKSFQEGFYYKPRIDYELLKQYSSDLICLTGGLRGEIPYQFLEFGEERAIAKIRELKEIFGENLYLELNRTGLPEWERINEFMARASQQEGVPLVAANDVHYLMREDSFTQEVLVCIGTNKTLQDESRLKLGSQEFWFKGAEQMRELFKNYPSAAENTLKIASLCNVEFKLKDENGRQIYHLPNFPTHDGRTEADEIRVLALQGLEDRFVESEKRGEPVAQEKRPSYYKRLDYELSVIKDMGFNGYFLIVQDFIQWAKRNGIPVGPGRGSGAGSLVAYSLKITDLDPMSYNLIFERFLNPERISMPDFDVDFCQDRRHEVINYVTEKYGAATVSQIITFGKLQTKAALRDVGRVMGMTFQEVDVISKLIPEKLGITLDEAIEMEPRLRELMENEPRIATLMDLAKRIEGLNRHAGIHAAGVVISDGPLVENAPLYKGADGENVIQYDMKMAEKIGLIKFDFLGLKTLTLINDAFKLIKKNRGKDFSVSDISLNDKGIYDIMSRGNTAGIFQFEGDGISDLIKKIKPNCFEDITAINALYRPGPMQMLDEYTGRKHGKIKVSYLFPELEEILKETYGIIVYQEQVQLIAARIASYSLGEADMLRRAMGKKIASEMADQKSRFMEGALKNGHDQKKASELFDLMAKFAEYGFNKSHAAAYCVVAAQTAWLKQYYPVEFYASLMSTELSDTDKVVKYIKDAHKQGIAVRPPHINFSDFKFSVNADEVFFGLGAIKGIGEGAVESILEARAKQPSGKFETLEEFFNTVDLKRISKKAIECLIKSGALDGFGFHRAQLMSCYSQFVDIAGKAREDREIGQGSLFDLEVSQEKKSVAIQVPNVSPWPKNASLAYEKEVLGFFLSDHPLSGMESILKVWTTSSIADLKNFERKHKIIIGGILTSKREMITKKGTRMAFAQIEDLTGAIEAVIFPDAFAKIEGQLIMDEPLLVEGVLEREDDRSKILVERVTPVKDRTTSIVKMKIKIDENLSERLPELREIIHNHPGKTALAFELALKELNRTVALEVLEPQGLMASSGFFEDLQNKFGRTDFVSLDS